MNEVEIMKKLKKVAGFYELYHKTSFIGYRHPKSGGSQKVSVDILDAGSEAGDIRYACEATSEDGKVATGNNGPSLEVVLATVHWQDLDR
jgi:hypothetical protein